jgi:hypothetical protein
VPGSSNAEDASKELRGERYTAGVEINTRANAGEHLLEGRLVKMRNAPIMWPGPHSDTTLSAALRPGLGVGLLAGDARHEDSVQDVVSQHSPLPRLARASWASR